MKGAVDLERGAKYSDIKVGDFVLVRQTKKNKLSTKYNPAPHRVTKIIIILTSQGATLSFLIDNSLKMANSLWSSVQSSMPRNIFNFTVRYLNNSLATRRSLARWNLSQSADCSFCLRPESLLHVVAGCKTYLNEGRFTWRHNSALLFIANSLQSIVGSTLYVDLPGFLSPCIVTGDAFRPDLLLVTADKRLFMLELTVGFETNLNINAQRKRDK